LFRGAVIIILGENMVIDIPSGKELWDALEAKFGVSNAGSELYVMEQFYDYMCFLRSLTTSSEIF
jgi:hypothetical protein